jgi:hypothetical protein
MKRLPLFVLPLALLVVSLVFYWSALNTPNRDVQHPVMHKHSHAVQPRDPITGRKMDWETYLYRRTEAFQDKAHRR